MSIFTGAGVAIVTPMKANGEVNYPKLEESLSSQVLVPIVLRPQSICLRKRKNTAQMVCCWYLLIITKQLRKV